MCFIRKRGTMCLERARFGLASPFYPKLKPYSDFLVFKCSKFHAVHLPSLHLAL